MKFIKFFLLSLIIGLVYSVFSFSYAWDFPVNAQTIGLSRTGATTGQTILTVPTGQVYTILSIRSSNEKNTGIVEVKCENGAKTLFYSATVLQAIQVYTQHICSAGTIQFIVTGGGGGDQHNIYITYVDSSISVPTYTVVSDNPPTQDFIVNSVLLYLLLVISAFIVYNLVIKIV